MAKSVFKYNEITASKDKIMLELPRKFAVEEEPEPIKAEDVYQGPTADDLRREAEEFKVSWEEEKKRMLADAESAAQEIIKNAENAAFDEVKRKTDQAQELRRQAEEDANSIIREAEEKAKRTAADAEELLRTQKKEGFQSGYSEGRERGFEEGKAEADRLVERLHTLIEKTMEKRSEILSETEAQVVDLVLLLTRKVVKVVSENQKNVVTQNTLKALRKVKGRGDVTLRVNLADLDMTARHTKDFIAAVENIKNITVVEDSTVDQGGCIVETDFGEIDARIESQLHELEEKILEISPIRARAKKPPASE